MMKIKVISFAGFRHVLGKEMQVELPEKKRRCLDLLEATLCLSPCYALDCYLPARS